MHGAAPPRKHDSGWVTASKPGRTDDGPPLTTRDHLLGRRRDRKITAEDHYQLKLWRQSDPDAPDAPWYKYFGSFKVCGDGEYPKTFLLRGQPAQGRKL